MVIVLFLLFISLSFSRTLETCYRVYFFIFPVAESCVIYKKEGESFEISSWVKTAGIGGIVKKVNSSGKSILENFEPKTFYLFQREGTFFRDHIYIFHRGGVKYRIIRIKKEGNIVKEGFFRTSLKVVDPFTATLIIYTSVPNFKKVPLFLFYDAKVQKIHFQTLKEEKIHVYEEDYDTWKVLLDMNIKTRGLLKPKGTWIIWVDKETYIPVKLKVEFTIGSAYILLKSVKGDINLLREIRPYMEP